MVKGMFENLGFTETQSQSSIWQTPAADAYTPQQVAGRAEKVATTPVIDARPARPISVHSEVQPASPELHSINTQGSNLSELNPVHTTQTHDIAAAPGHYHDGGFKGVVREIRDHVDDVGKALLGTFTFFALGESLVRMIQKDKEILPTTTFRTTSRVAAGAVRSVSGAVIHYSPAILEAARRNPKSAVFITGAALAGAYLYEHAKD